MCEICVFAGTTEGRRLAESLAGQPIRVTVCVATEYGETLIPASDNIQVLAGRLDLSGMVDLFGQHAYSLVIDATHPFATAVSENLMAACGSLNIEYLRLNRDGDEAGEDAVCVDSVAAAAEYLKTHPGVALLATGSKELKPYTQVPDYQQRFYPRVLPMAASLAACEAAGFPPSHIIAMQGPFSLEMNVATLKGISARWLVTKASGKSGGFDEKLRSARLAGARCIVIGQPRQVKGLGLEAALQMLAGRFGLAFRRSVTVVGIGMGSPDTLTQEADRALLEAQCFIGARRMLEAVSRYGKPAYAEISPQKIVACMDAHPEVRRFAVVMSGDSGFYSGTKKLLPLLSKDEVRVVPGLSSMQVLCARVKTSWDDVTALSLHGRAGSAAGALRRHGKVFALMDGADAVRRICADLIEAGLGSARVSVGERLSYPDEKITQGTAEALSDYRCDPLSAVLLEAPLEPSPLPVGLPDEAFIRELGGEGNRAVPMTKAEVRSVSIAKLRLTEDAVVVDVGAGTGSVSVEAALNCPSGHVYAIECREDAAELIEKNRRHFGLDNLTVVRGLAPEAMAGLPAPTHAFIGGSSGNMADIVEALLQMNPGVRIVINAIALESTGEMADIAHRFNFREADIVQLNVARARKAGRYHLMTGLNPIVIAAFQGVQTAEEAEKAPFK